MDPGHARGDRGPDRPLAECLMGAATPKLPIDWSCQFCKNGLHRSCPGAVRTPRGLLLCSCGVPDFGHPPRPRCLDCHEERIAELDTAKWVCVDQYGCAARVQARKDASPLYQMLIRCRVSAVNTRRRQRALSEAIRAVLPIDEDAEYVVVRTRTPAKPKVGQCLCCGEATRGGRFLPGHDAKYKGATLRAARAGDLAAQERCIEHKWSWS